MKCNSMKGTREMEKRRGAWTVFVCVLLVIALSGALSGCGYHVAGKGGSSQCSESSQECSPWSFPCVPDKATLGRIRPRCSAEALQRARSAGSGDS